MVPGCVAGLYKPEETMLHLEPLAKWAGIDFINDKVVDIDIENNQITLAGGQGPKQIPFDAISIDIGSRSRGLNETKGAMQYTIPTRPISDLVKRLEKETEELKQSSHPVNVVVIGGGAAGIELSMSLNGRWQKVLGKDNIRVTLLDSGSELFPSETTANRGALLRVMSERGIHIRHNCFVEEVTQNSILLTGGETVDFTHCLWATGASAHELAFRLQERGLACSDYGWFRVNEHLQSISHPRIFAAGDCCTMEREDGSPPPPKAGVYAVRSGPILIENLTKFLVCDNNEEKPELVTYKPQGDFLKLLVCGDGAGLGFRFGLPIFGKWVFQLKDAIDVSFMDLFKEENLPELVEGQPYDTSQYDAVVERPSPKEPSDAAALLQRTDDDVDFQEAWDVLRDMAGDVDYQKKVLERMKVDACTA